MFGMFTTKTRTTSKESPRSLNKKPPSKPAFDEFALESFYNRFADPEDPEIISIEGIGKLCEALGVDPSADVRSLVMMWKLGALSKPGQISKEEFLKGCKALFVNDIDTLRSRLPSFDPGFLDRNEFRDFYRFVFQFSREGTHKTLEKEVVAALFPIVLDTTRAPHLTAFLAFLEQSNHHRITLDQWDSFLLFNHTVKFDLSNFEDDGAWPLLLDEYVEWRRKSGK